MPEETEKKILIITYYWPPSGGSGVQRWLKFVKYLPVFGWKPYVFTPEKPAFDIVDESLLADVPEEAEVLRFPIWEPYDIFFKLSRLAGARRSAKPTELVQSKDGTIFQSVMTWIRGNLFIPDPRIFWVRPSVSFLQAFLKDNRIRTIVTTGPPHSMHLIGLKLKKGDPSLRWIADFRDPWSEWGLLDSLKAGAAARRKHRRLERSVLSSADEVLTVTPFYVKQFEAVGQRQVHLVTNGFDESDFTGLHYVRPEKFVIRHVGIINEKCDPRPFMNAVESLASENREFAHAARIEFVGEVHPSFRRFVEVSPVLKRISSFPGNVPHKQLLKMYETSWLLLLVLHGYKDAEGYLPGKLFEYIATGLPVLGIGPSTGDAAALLNETGGGRMIDSLDAEGMRQSLLLHFEEWKTGTTPRQRSKQSQRLSRKTIVAGLVAMIERVNAEAERRHGA